MVTERAQPRRRRGKDWRLRFKELFDERLKKGQTFYIPCLGWKEFVPSYFGLIREGTKREESVDDIVIPSLLRSMWDHQRLNPEFVLDWRIIKGMMSYSYPTPTEEVSNAE